MDTSDNYDVIIIGGGAAGISSALWCDELGLNTLLLEKSEELGGQLLRVYNPIQNHLGAAAENGRNLRDVFVKQIENRNFAIELAGQVAGFDAENKTLTLKTGEKLSAKAIIIATGVSRRKLNIPGENEFKDRGILESGKRDPNKAAEKTAAVIGGGDAAFENALILAETASQVTIIHRSANFRARPEFFGRVKNNPKIKIFPATVTEEILGDENVQALKLRDTQTEKTFILPVESVLIRIGVEPDTAIFRGQIELDKNGYVKINQNCRTNISGILAVGDVASPLSPTVSTAVGMGATAAKVIFEEIFSF